MFLKNGIQGFIGRGIFKKLAEKLNEAFSKCLTTVGVEKPLHIAREVPGKVIIGMDPESWKKIMGDEQWILVSDSPDFAEIQHGDPQTGDDDKKVTLTATTPLSLSAAVVMEHDDKGHYVNSTEIISALSINLTPLTTVVQQVVTDITSLTLESGTPRKLTITYSTMDHTVKTTAAGIVVESTYGNLVDDNVAEFSCGSVNAITEVDFDTGTNPDDFIDKKTACVVLENAAEGAENVWHTTTTVSAITNVDYNTGTNAHDFIYQTTSSTVLKKAAQGAETVWHEAALQAQVVGDVTYSTSSKKLEYDWYGTVYVLETAALDDDNDADNLVNTAVVC